MNMNWYISSDLKKAVIVDSIIHSEHFDRLFNETDLDLEFRKLKIALKKSPFGQSKPLDISFLDPQSSQLEYFDWMKKLLLDESEI